MSSLRLAPALLAPLLAWAWLTACTDRVVDIPEEAPDTEEPREDEPEGSVDAGLVDAPIQDASTPESFVPDPNAILGTITGGSCGIVKTLLLDPKPSFERNAIQFVKGERFDKASLSDDADRMYDTPNAGGSSIASEVMSLEILRVCEGARLLKTETQIKYDPTVDAGGTSMSDMLLDIGGTRIGVNPVRVYKPASIGLTDADVKQILANKFHDINVSSRRVSTTDKWKKQILHIFSPNDAATKAVERVLPTFTAAERADTIVLLTQSTGGGFLYCNKPTPELGSECP